MPDVPISYISAFRAPGRRPGFDNALSRDFPNITNVDVSASIGQVQRVLDQVIRAVEFLFGFTLAAGLVVLFAAVTATREARAREFAVMRAMGASSHAAGAGAARRAAGRRCAGRRAGLAARRWPWAGRWRATSSSSAGTRRPGCRWPGAAAGALLALAAGWWGLREVLRRPVVETLRAAAE